MGVGGVRVSRGEGTPTHATVHLRQPEDGLWEVLSFHCVGFGAQTQVIRLGNKYFNH